MKKEKIWSKNTISLSKFTEQSSVFNKCLSSNAITGVPHFGNLYNSITNMEKDPWWQVDLGDNYLIDEIVIWNAITDSKSLFITDQSFYIFISLKPFGLSTQARRSGMTEIESCKRRSSTFKKVFNYIQCVLCGMKVSVDLPQCLGRYVRIQSKGITQLALSQVQVIGRVSSQYSHSNRSMYIIYYNIQNERINGNFMGYDKISNIR